MTIGWGIVGLGNIAARMAKAVEAAQGAELIAVCSRDHAKAKTFARQHGAANAYTVYEEMLRDPAVQAVYVSSPNALHASQTVAALQAGKHVLVEKPMALTVAEAEQMAATARSNGRLLGVGFHLRRHPVHAEMRRLLAAGEVGEPIFASAVWGSYTPDYPRDRWQMDPNLAGAGSIMGIGVHLLDLLCWLLGREVEQVAAFADGPSERYPVEFLTAGLLRFRGGAVAEFTSSRRLPNSPNSIVVYCEGGRLEGQSTLGMDPAGRLAIVRGAETLIKHLPLRDLYVEEVEAFCHAAEKGEPFSASGEDGVRSVALTNAVLAAAREGRAVNP
ncbi:MAG: Gfo/Idh/MocA family protein [Chloroflexota bacterium]